MVPLEGTVEDVPSRLVISSVGSIPEPLEDIPMHGEVFRLKDARTGKLEGLDGVFAVGNAVTGKGNITDSQRHGRVVSRHMLENYLQGVASGYEEVLADAEAEAGGARGRGGRLRHRPDPAARRAGRQDPGTGPRPPAPGGLSRGLPRIHGPAGAVMNDHRHHGDGRASAT